LRGKVLVAGGAIEVASVRSCEKLPPCLIKPVPAGSKMDLLLAKARPISDGGSALVITCLRRGKKNVLKWQSRERGVRGCERNYFADTKVSEKQRGGDARNVGAESLPLQLMMKTMVRQAVPLQPMEVHGGADIHLQPVEGTPRWSRWIPEGGCDLMGRPRWSRLLPGPADPWREEPTTEQVCWQGW